MEGNLPCNNFLLTLYFKNIETGETISTSALDNMGWDCPKKTSRCKDWTKFGQGYNWKCSNEESVIGTQCRLNCWKGKYGVHNTTVECKGDKWKVICLIMIF